MARILALSSQVVRGRIGLNAARPALETLGHEVLALPSVLLSNHPGHRITAGAPLPVDLLASIVEGLDANGWLAGVDGLLTGYLPTLAHVALAENIVGRLRARAPGARYVCDPILGDDPKGLYVPEMVASQIRDRLLPLADLIVPNRFELAWLAQAPVRSPADAAAAAAVLAPRAVIATSVPDDGDRLATVLVGGALRVMTSTPRRPVVPHGTGDLLSGLVLGHWLAGADLAHALALSTAGVTAALEASLGADELCLGATATAWSHPVPDQLQAIGGITG